MTDSNIPKKILVVEDEEYLRDLYVQILKQEGYDVSAATDGSEGLGKIQKEEYDLILLDIILPKIDGLEVLEQCKNSGLNVASKVVLLTNLSQDLVVAKAKDYGVRGYMIKSDLTPAEIISEVKHYLTEGTPKTALI